MAAEEPLLLVVETEPTETSFFPVGGSVRLHLSIVDSDAKMPTDPDTLTWTVTPPFTTPTTYTYGVGSTIVKVSQGVYYVDMAHTAPGKWRNQYLCVLNSIQCGSNTTETIAVQSAYW